MAGTVKNVWLKNLLVGMLGKPLAREFDTASCNLKQTQEALLMKVVQSCRATAFGRDHGFDKITNTDEYRKSVPVRDFEGHRNYIEQMTRGASDILFPGRPLFYNTTSGTSSQPKQIPVSREYFDKAYTKISRLWLYTCMRDNPGLFRGKNLSSVGPAEEGKVEDGTPFGSLSGAVYRNIPGVLKEVYSTPYAVFCMSDYEKKYYALLRCALGTDITYIICANPSSLIRFHQTVMDSYTDMVRDIHDGTLRADVAENLPLEDKAAVLAGFKPDHKRAKFLERIIIAHGTNLRPKHYWPNLACVNTWKQGNCAQFLPHLTGYYPETAAIREFGYQASEARAGLTLANNWGYSVLAAHVYHFEFIPEAERDSKTPEILPAHQLEKGRQYYLLITNTSGLYRYDINDIIEVVGFYNQTPLFKFIRKGDGFTSLTGEKLSETQVLEAVDKTRVSENLQVPHFTLCCDEKNLCYKLFVEFPPQTAPDRKASFAAALDRCLQSINPEYESKRRSNRLTAPSLHELPADSYELIKKILVERDLAREGQYKVVYLQRKPQVLQILEELAS